jgi:hypothetical protein
MPGRCEWVVRAYVEDSASLVSVCLKKRLGRCRVMKCGRLVRLEDVVCGRSETELLQKRPCLM